MTTPELTWTVHRLLHRYVAAVDAQDVDTIRACFGTDGTLVLRGVERRGDDLAAFYRERLAFPTLHLITGITVTSGPGGDVTAGCGLFAVEMRDDGWRGVVGRYDDVVHVDGDAATFVRREITIARRVRISPDV